VRGLAIVRGSLAALALVHAAACGGEPSGGGAPVSVSPSNMPGGTTGTGAGEPGGKPSVGGGSLPGAVCAPSARVQPRLYRLSAGQFGNSLKDLLRLQQSPTIVGDTEATLLFYPREDAPVQSSIGEGFSRASRAALEVLDVASLSGCTLAAAAPDAQETACAQAFLEGFASRAFRRPLDPVDRDALLVGSESPFVIGNATGAANGLRLALEAILNAPSFLYRKELGGADGRLSSLETAEQLAFLLRDSVPDEALWDEALADRLQTDEQISAQLDRMLVDPVVRANITRIVGAWFGADRILQVSKDPSVFPGFNAKNLQKALFESLRLFIDDVLWNQGGSLSALLSSPRVFLNADLAQTYALKFDGNDPTEFIPFDLPAERAGILTQPALMAAFASSLETSIVKRGLFIVRRALCLPAPPAPSPEIFALATAQASDFSRTEKQKAAFRNDPANPCSGCHGLIDPYGIVFENYDAVGRHRDALLNGEPVDASTAMNEQIILPEERRDDDEDFTERVADALDFTQKIGQTEQFAYCGSKQLTSYALGLEVDESCVKEDLQNGTINSDMTIGEVIRNVVLDDLTRRRVAAGGI
jgi:Protein of unknown function (DUF1592)/Protein of unknown function (DUF1588)/Protein of unknown function (DUF1595)